MPFEPDALALERPRSLKQALAMLADDASLTPMAGCTDVFVALHFGSQRGRRFLDLWPLDELRGIEELNGVLRIGALTSYTEIIRSRLVQRRVPMLVASAKEVGGAQIQNREIGRAHV